MPRTVLQLLICSLLVGFTTCSLGQELAAPGAAEDATKTTEVTASSGADAEAAAETDEVATAVEDVATADESKTGKMVLVVGAGGAPEYQAAFSEWAENWKLAAQQSGLDFVAIGTSSTDGNDRDVLKEELEKSFGESAQPLWLVMIGHGTHDRNVTKFNLRGPDVSAADLQEWLAPAERPLIVIGGFSCSGGMLNTLQGENRVVITATNSGVELNYSRFGGFLAEAVGDLEADLDHDDQVSLLEAYLLASSNVARFYESDARLATEHSLLEDNHDGKGTSADFFVGIRASGRAKDGSALDGRLAHRYILIPSENAPNLSPAQLAERDRLESEIESLRDRKTSLSEDDYFDQLEALMISMAKLYNAE